MSGNKFNYAFNADGPRPPCGKNCPDRAVGCSLVCERWKAYLEARNANYAERQKKTLRRLPTAASEKSLSNRLNQEEFLKKRNRRK